MKDIEFKAAIHWKARKWRLWKSGEWRHGQIGFGFSVFCFWITHYPSDRW